MTISSASLTVLVGDNFVCVKIAGRANFASSPDFKTLIEQLQQKNYGHFVIDLSECALMDSTFLGVLAQFGLRLNTAGAAARAGIELSNPNPRVTELLENLGALHLFKILSGELALPGVVETSTPTSIHPSREQIARTSLEAHQTLMQVNPDNYARFKDVTQFLAEDLHNLQKAR